MQLNMETPHPLKPPSLPSQGRRSRLRIPPVLIKLPLLILIVAILGLLLLDMFVPATPERAVLRELGAVTHTSTTVLGTKYTIRKATVTTDDYRTINAELIVPEGADGQLPLVIIASAFLRTEDVLAMLGPTGNNAVIVYTPPQLYNMFYGITAASNDSSSLRVFWEALRLNPVNRWANIYIGLNRSSSDIIRLVDWARETADIDIDRVNLVGLGLGSLGVTQAALALEHIGLPPRTLTLVFPPADLEAAVSATYGNSFMAKVYGKFNAFMLRRMVLNETLPLTNTADKLLIVPKAEFEIPTYAVEPVKQLARSGRKKVSHIDINYQGWSLPHYTRAIRDEIYTWLRDKQAIAP